MSSWIWKYVYENKIKNKNAPEIGFFPNCNPKVFFKTLCQKFPIKSFPSLMALTAAMTLPPISLNISPFLEFSLSSPSYYLHSPFCFHRHPLQSNNADVFCKLLYTPLWILWSTLDFGHCLWKSVHLLQDKGLLISDLWTSKIFLYRGHPLSISELACSWTQKHFATNSIRIG